MLTLAMRGRRSLGSPACSRRAFLRLTWGSVGLLGWGGAHRAWGAGDSRYLQSDDPELLPPFERLHVPLLRLPVVTANGAKIPVTVEMTHPMEPGHFISTVSVVNPRDPLPSKGVFHFTPANGRAAVSFQARMDQGRSEVSVTAECNLHGRWSSTGSINVAEGAGGCATMAPAPVQAKDDEIRPPAIRIPAMLKRGRLRPDETVRVELETRHPNRTGLGVRNRKFVQVSEPFHLVEIDVFYDHEQVSRFDCTAALSDDQFIGFWLRIPREGLLRALLTNNRGQRFEAVQQIRFS